LTTRDVSGLSPDSAQTLALNAQIMAAGAFIAGLGAALIAAVPMMLSLDVVLNGGYQLSKSTAAGVNGILWFGILMVPLGLAFLAYGVAAQGHKML
jgi:hypothetical protein